MALGMMWLSTLHTAAALWLLLHVLLLCSVSLLSRRLVSCCYAQPCRPSHPSSLVHVRTSRSFVHVRTSYKPRCPGTDGFVRARRYCTQQMRASDGDRCYVSRLKRAKRKASATQEARPTPIELTILAVAMYLR